MSLSKQSFLSWLHISTTPASRWRTSSIQQNKYMLMEIFNHHNRQIAELTGQEYSPATLERYKTSYKHTLSFLKKRYNVSDIDITELGYEFITEYEFWLKSTRRHDHNTTMKYLSNFRKIVNRCIRNQYREIISVGWQQYSTREFLSEVFYTYR